VQPLQLSGDAQFEPTGPDGGYPELKTVLEWYKMEAGWDPADDFAFANAFCLMRNGVISQGIAARVARGQASSVEAHRYGTKMFPLGELAWKTIQEYESKKRVKAKL
jgi:hypothetical protein